MQTKKLGDILFLLDDRLTRERISQLNRVITGLRHFAQVHLVKAGLTEDEFLKVLEQHRPKLVFLPWYRYLSWSRVEGHFGLTRSSGPTVVGYHAEPVLPYELGLQPEHLRSLILDFCHTSVADAQLLVKSLIVDSTRTGIRPYHLPNTTIYCENWFVSQGMGMRLDSLLTLKDITQSDWILRSNPIRLSLMAFWNLIYDLGPGKSDLREAVTLGTPKAYFQLGADRQALTLRLCYNMPSWGPKDILHYFWPDPKQPAKPSQLLATHADFLRVHWIPESNDIEIVAGFLPSAPAATAPEQVRTIWIEPISARLMKEPFGEMPHPEAPHLKALPSLSFQDFKPSADVESMRAELRAKEKFILDANAQIRQLQIALKEKEDRLRELKHGGVGTAGPLPPPDAASLLEAFQERFFDARFQIRQFEAEIRELTRRKAGTDQIENLNVKMQALISQEKEWIAKLESAIQALREEKLRTTR